jgi:hypothetical protein
MSWIAQVGHVMRKDARQWHRQLWVYGLIVLVATAHAMGLFTNEFGLLGTPVLVIFGMVMVVSSVQADSPIQTNAFWASRPLYPSAVLCAKMGLAVLVLVIPGLLGELVGLIALHTPAGLLAGMLAGSATRYALWLLLAMVLAAMTRDFRSVVVAALLIPMSLLVLASIANSNSSAFRSAGQSRILLASLILLIVAGAVTLLVRLFTVRSTRRVLWVATAVVVAMLTVTALMDFPSQPAAPPAGVARPVIHAVLGPSTHGRAPGRFELRLSAEQLDSSARTILFADSVVLHPRGGGAVRVGMVANEAALNVPPLPTNSQLHWVGGADEPFRSSALMFDLSVDQQRAIAPGLDSAELVGRIELAVPVKVGTLPLRVGSRITDDGTRIIEVPNEHSTEAGSVSLSSFAVASSRRVSASRFDQPIGYALSLINEQRHEAMRLSSRNSSNGPDWVVLPGIPVSTQIGRFVPAMPPDRADSAAQRDDSWFSAAKLSIVRWQLLGSYRVDVRVGIQQSNPLDSPQAPSKKSTAPVSSEYSAPTTIRPSR